MKELLKQIIFEQQEYCKNIAQDTVPRDIEEEWLITTEILIITGIRYKTLWKVCFAPANA